MSAGFRSLLSSFLRLNRQQRRAQGNSQRYRLSMESLEERAVPAAYYFENAASNAAGLTSTIDNFKTKLAGPLIDSFNQVAAASGYRDVGFDGLSNGVINPLAGNYFTQSVSRGLLLSTPGSGFQVSQSAGGTQRFGNIDPSYTSLFTTFSATQLLTPMGSRITDVTFTDPQNPQNTGNATVRGFGAIFSDVDDPNSTTFEAFGMVGGVETSLTGVRNVQVMNNGLSFVGVVFSEGERITRVRLTSGNTALAAGQLETGGADLVVLDNMLYSQPQPNATRFYKWNDAAPDNGNWNDPANWTLTSGTAPAPAQAFPQNSGDVAIFADNLTGNKNITVPTNTYAIGSMQFDTPHTVTFNGTGNGKFNFFASGNNQPQAALELHNNKGNATVNFNVPVQFTSTWQVTTLGTTVAQFSQQVNSGSGLTQRGSGTLNFAGAGINHNFNGPVNVLGGTVSTNALVSDSRINLENGRLNGNGTVDGITAVDNTTNFIAPGTSSTTGTITSSGSVTLNNNTTLTIKIRAANDFDKLVATGDVDLNSANLVLDFGGFVPAVGASFNFLSVQGNGNSLSNDQFAQGTTFSFNGMLFQLAYNRPNNADDSVTLTRISTDTSVAISRTPNNNSTFGSNVQFTATVTTGAGTPTGDIRFDYLLGGVIVATETVPLTGNAASDNINNLNAGNYTVQATYLPTGIFTGSSSTFDHVVTATNVTTTATTTDNNAVFTTPTIRARVLNQGGSLVPTGGLVTFVDANNIATVFGSANIDGSGFATLPGFLNVGSYSIKALFSSTDANFNSDATGTQSNTLNQTITRASTSTSLSSNPAVWNFNQDITFTATVTTGVPVTPTGSIQFILVGPNTVLGTVPLAGNQAQLTVQLPAGSQTVRADYVPSVAPQNFNGSSGTQSQTVNAVAVNIALAPTNTATVFGQGFSYTTTITAANGLQPIPAGNVIFTLIAGGTTFTSSAKALNASGETTVTQADFAGVPTVNTYTLRVAYQGSQQYLAKNTDFADALTISRADTTTTLGDTAGIAGQPITSTAILNVIAPGAGAPGGTMRFTITGPMNLVSNVPVQNNGGVFQATLNRNDLIPGAYTYVAEYLDSTGQFNGSSSTVQTITVSTADAVLTLNPNPTSSFADTVIFTANVTSALLPSGVAVGGNVRFSMFNVSNGNLIGQADRAVTNGVASFTAPALLPVGQYQVFAQYLGDTSYNPTAEQNILHTITSAATGINVVLQPLPGSTTTYGEQLTFRASVLPINAAAGIPTGTVIFRIINPNGGPDIVSAPIPLNVAGSADYSPTQVLPPTEGKSPLQVIATYQGDDVFNRFQPSSNINNPLLQTILRADVAITFTMTRISDNATSDFRYSDSVKLSARVNVDGLDPASALRAGTPAGTVQFFYISNGKEVALGNPVVLNAQGEATLSSTTIAGKVVPIRLPTGNDQPFLVKYIDTRSTPLFNAEISTSNISVRAVNLVPNAVLSIVPKTGAADKNRKYAYGRSLVISVVLKPEIAMTAGVLINGQAVETTPKGTGFMQFTSSAPSGIQSATDSVVFTTPTLNITDPPRTVADRTLRFLSFTSAALFNNTIGNRNPTSPQSLLIPTGVFSTTVNITMQTSNFGNITNLVYTNAASIFTVARSTIGRRW